LFDKFGGHSHAAGLTIRRPRLKELVDALNAHASDCLSEEDLKPSIEVDLELEADEISPELLREMARLEPFGPGNPRPVFVSRGLSLADNPRVLKEKHLKFHVWSGQGRRLEVIWWDGVHALGEQTLTQGTGIELAYTLEPNTWRGEVRLQMCVQDLVVI
jgi:single-stranded-DNA-specific exonuclease